MNNTNLERAQQIRLEIEDLRKSLSQIARGKLFDLDVGHSCSVTMYRYADPFLATVENDIKTYANTKILEKIELLEAEFKSL